VKPAPYQPAIGRDSVRFDPCFDIGDDTIARAGFDPKSRQRSDQIHQDYAFISCTFDRKDEVDGMQLTVGSLTISSTNVTLDEFRKREGGTATGIVIDGRQAITYATPVAEVCTVVMAGPPDSTIDVDVGSTVALTKWNACDHAQEIATVIAQSLPSQ
jgi:hypothetical protein